MTTLAGQAAPPESFDEFSLEQIAGVETLRELISALHKSANAIQRFHESIIASIPGRNSLLRQQKIKDTLALKPKVIAICKSKRDEFGKAGSKWTKEAAQALNGLLKAIGLFQNLLKADVSPSNGKTGPAVASNKVFGETSDFMCQQESEPVSFGSTAVTSECRTVDVSLENLFARTQELAELAELAECVTESVAGDPSSPDLFFLTLDQILEDINSLLT